MSLLLPRTPNFTSAAHKGAAAVEFALILPVLIMILAGIFEFGRTFWYYDALSKATRDGARLMSVTDKATIASQGIPAVKQLVADAVSSAGVPSFSTANVSVVCLDSSFNNNTCADGTIPGGVSVRIVNYTMTIGQFIPFLIGGSSTYPAALAPYTTMRYML